MITLVIAFAAGFSGFGLMHWGFDVGLGWSIFWGFLAFMAAQGGLSYCFMRKMKADMLQVQELVAEGQKAVEAKTRAWQFRPPGSVQEAQRIVQAEIAGAVRKALAKTGELAKYKPWVLMVGKQIATAQMHLNWMIKDFKAVDELMPMALLMDPVSLSMKMARLYMLDASIEDIEKVYEKAIARTRYNENVLPAAAFSWMLVKRGGEANIDKAFKVLGDALKKSDDPTLKKNHELLMNNRTAQFTNSGLGDKWYTLHLEEPKVKAQRQRSVYR